MICPHCSQEISDEAMRHHLAVTYGRQGGRVKTQAKARAARLNGLKGGRPRKEKKYIKQKTKQTYHYSIKRSRSVQLAGSRE